MKKIVKTLVKKGWSKNEIIYEIQRVYGNDVLIQKFKLNDERGFAGKYGFPMTVMGSLTLMLFLRRKKFMTYRPPNVSAM
jgi:hypothetical protein